MNHSKIGEHLKLIRERKGLSYEQIFEITKIQPSILKGIEEGKSIVSPVFLRGFIKTYAISLGLDPDVLFQLSEAGSEKTEEVKPVEVTQKPEKPKRKYLLYLLLFAALPLILLTIWFKNTTPHRTGKREEKREPFVNKNTEAQEEASLKKQSLSPPAILKSSDEVKSPESEKAVAQELLVSDQSLLFQKIKGSLFKKEVLIQSSEAMDIYFKLDKKSMITKRLNPYEWFQMKAQENIYLRFDKIQGDVSIFYNGTKVDFESYKGFFERNFL